MCKKGELYVFSSMLLLNFLSLYTWNDNIPILKGNQKIYRITDVINQNKVSQSVMILSENDPVPLIYNMGVLKKIPQSYIVTQKEFFEQKIALDDRVFVFFDKQIDEINRKKILCFMEEKYNLKLKEVFKNTNFRAGTNVYLER